MPDYARTINSNTHTHTPTHRLTYGRFIHYTNVNVYIFSFSIKIDEEWRKYGKSQVKICSMELKMEKSSRNTQSQRARTDEPRKRSEKKTLNSSHQICMIQS